MILFIFTWFYIPETRGEFFLSWIGPCGRGRVDLLIYFVSCPADRTLEEIHEMFEAKLPARKFKGYVCEGVERYAADAVGEKSAEKVGAMQVERISGEA